MDYFVSANYEPYDQWQIELLIESFKYHKLDDNLCISFAKNPGMGLHKEFSKNISKHKKITFHENIGAKRGSSLLNKFYAVYWALKENLIQQPFILIEPDMVLHSKPPEIKEPGFSFQVDPYFTSDLVNQNIDCENILKTQLNQKRWPLVGKIIYFNGIPLSFFEQTTQLMEKLLFRQLFYQNKIWEASDQLVWNLQIYNCVGKTAIRGDYNYESNLLNHQPRHFIHYEAGFVPIFTKEMFPYAAPNFISLGNPFKVLKENAPTGSFNYLSKLAKNYLAS